LNLCSKINESLRGNDFTPRLAETHLHPDKGRRKIRDGDVLSNKWLLHIFAFRIVFHCNTTKKKKPISVLWSDTA
jgi:hypothetical protein